MRNFAILPPIKGTVRIALLNLPAFLELATSELIAMARALPGGTKVSIPDRLTAIVLLLGTRSPLRQDLPANHIRRTHAALTISDGNVLDDRTSVAVHGVRPNHGAVLRD
jgi:hypothetical protein